MLIGVSAAELPLRAHALLDPEIPRPADSRFQVRRTHLVWIPLAWLGPLLVVGFSSLRSTIAAWPDPAAGPARVIYGSMTTLCVIFAAVCAHRLALGIGERDAVKQGRCGFPTQSALWLWKEHGDLPEGGWWR